MTSSTTDRRRAYTVLGMNTFAFTVAFATWMMYGVLITFLVDNGEYDWSKAQMGWLIGVPVLTGALMRLPVGVLTDKYGGRIVYASLLLVSAVPMFLVSYADSFIGFLLAGLGFGLAGASFAVGIAFTSIWFDRKHQGTALGIFGAGNAGAAITSMLAPVILNSLTNDGADIDQWRVLPQIYAAVLAVTGVLFYLFTYSKKVEAHEGYTMRQRLAPLRYMRVWRFGLYYFLVFGGFVALAQWLIPYYVNVYTMSVASAGLMAAIFSMPSGLIRAFGGWMSDRIGARAVMYGILGVTVICLVFLSVPRMEIQSPGEGVLADRSGTVTSVSDTEITVGDKTYALKPKMELESFDPDGDLLLFPIRDFWHEPVVEVGDEVKRRTLLASGVSRIFFQANVWVFTGLVFVVGIALGIGMAAVYKHIPDYFPEDVAVVGGIVGVLGGLGGFVLPIIFGYLLSNTGIWTTNWMLLAVIAVVSLVWMQWVIQRMTRREDPELFREFEHGQTSRAEQPLGAQSEQIESVQAD
ncbi:MAG: NarK/NasA family nitrate transporter [Chloroflexi bacterium]|nr:NarK/NasA family nitrate transporter [Chloroflexota bacterium]